jgi:D-glycero-D-manno-heptose 1,7-bisphosphate phosphatase
MVLPILRDATSTRVTPSDSCRAEWALEYLLVVVTNQVDIARGYYAEGGYLELTDWMLANLLKQQIQIARVYHSPYHPIHGIGEYRRDSFDRKSNRGVLCARNESLIWIRLHVC